jgi:ATP-dependent Clp protease ATP-binding subunit ClpA
MIAAVAKMLRAEHGITLRADPSAIDALIAAGGYDATLGARPMKRVIGRLVEAPLAAAILSGELSRNTELTLEGHAGKVTWERHAVSAREPGSLALGG